MIELVFGESAGGALKIAKSIKNGNIIGEIHGRCRKRYSDASGISDVHDVSDASGISDVHGVSGNIGNVEVLTLYLDMGELTDMDSDMQSRKNLLKKLYGDFPGVWEEIWERNLGTLERLKRTKDSAEAIRIWISAQDPYDLCSLYFLCDFMAGSQVSLSLVCTPTESETNDGQLVRTTHYEILPEKLNDCLRYEVPISPQRRDFFAKLWRDLVQENGCLRAAVNGQIMSVPESFYDFAIHQCIPEGEFLTALLIGRTLPLLHGVGDQWIYTRIRAMVESGRLIQVSPSTNDHPYSAILKRRD